MRPFTIYHLYIDSFSAQQEKLVSIIVEIAKPDMIFLLGASLYRRRSESIFNTTAPTSQHTADYFLLILIPDISNRELHEWQDKIEHHCKALMPVTTIVLQTSTFEEWLKTDHPFAYTVLRSAAQIYDAGNLSFPAPGAINELTNKKDLEKYFTEGLNKSKEFLAGAELFRVREQNTMAAFMLHQSSEQALQVMLKIGTGFHSNTHSIDRLIRYASLVSYQLPDIFPQKSESDKRLFNLLQKAYIDTRYKEDYKISMPELLSLTEKVRRLQEILADIGKAKFNSSASSSLNNDG
ncbi:MAG: hypothetical protein JWP81_1558 [Ferruginibacter sp.]|nr:hypothetical protein [Ferruginibacter sp.]